MTAERINAHYVLRYVYAILAVVVITVTTVLSTLYQAQQDDRQTYERIQFYHLESVSASDEARREIADLKTIVQLPRAPGGMVPSGPEWASKVQVGPKGILQSVGSRVDGMSVLQRQYGGSVPAAIIERMMATLYDIEYQLDHVGGPTADRLPSIEVLAASIEQFNRLHKIEANRELQALSERQSERPRFLAVLLACLTFAGLATGYLVRSLKSSIARQHRTEAALVDSQERLHHMQKLDALGRLVGGVAHDFNNLLTVILGHIEILQLREIDNKDIESSLGEMQKAGNQATFLTQRLLVFSRRHPLKAEVLNLNEEVARLELLFERIVGEDVNLQFSYVDNPHSIEVDPDQLRQVIMNLIGNARDAMPNGGELEVRIDNVDVGGTGLLVDDLADGQYVRLEVADTGIGMDEEMIQRIFEPFFSSKDETRGTGLGLATVHGVVTGSGGHVHVESVVDKGTTFSVYFPRSDKSVPVHKESAGGDQIQRGNETILVVEDEESVLQLTHIGLSSLGYTVMTATNGADGLDICRRHPESIDVILSDVVMPGMSGPEFMAQALVLCEGAVPIFMSGHTRDVALGVGEIGDGEIPLLDKPFTLDELGELIRGQLAAQSR